MPEFSPAVLQFGGRTVFSAREGRDETRYTDWGLSRVRRQMKPEEIYELGEQEHSENTMKAKRKFEKKESARRAKHSGSVVRKNIVQDLEERII